MQMKYFPRPSSHPPTLLRKAVTIGVTIVLAGLVLMFSLLLLTAIAVGALIGGAYLWWKTRELRRRMREQMQGFPPRGAQPESDVFGRESFKGEVIEGEVVRVHEPGVRVR